MHAKALPGKYYLGYDIGGTKCSIVLGDKDFNIHEKIVFATETARGYQEIIKEFKTCMLTSSKTQYRAKLLLFSLV